MGILKGSIVVKRKYTRTFTVKITPSILSTVYAIFTVNYLCKEVKKFDVEIPPPKTKDEDLTILANKKEDVTTISNILKGIELGVLFGWVEKRDEA